MLGCLDKVFFFLVRRTLCLTLRYIYLCKFIHTDAELSNLLSVSITHNSFRPGCGSLHQALAVCTRPAFPDILEKRKNHFSFFITVHIIYERFQLNSAVSPKQVKNNCVGNKALDFNLALASPVGNSEGISGK